MSIKKVVIGFLLAALLVIPSVSFSSEPSIKLAQEENYVPQVEKAGVSFSIYGGCGGGCGYGWGGYPYGYNRGYVWGPYYYGNPYYDYYPYYHPFYRPYYRGYYW